ncbi:MAG: hypothetical protein AAFN44_16810 [Pseudomonadota bacterium]
MKNKPIISQDTAIRLLEDALRLRVGRGKRFSFEALEEGTGVPSRTLRSYAGEEVEPSLSNFLCLCAALGPSFASDVLAPCGLSAQSTEAAEADYMGALALMGEGVAMLAEALADGRVDHRERAIIEEFFKGALEKFQPLSQSDTAVSLKGVG